MRLTARGALIAPGVLLKCVGRSESGTSVPNLSPDMVICQVIYFQLKILKNKYMAEGGDISFENPTYDPDIDPDEDIDPNNYDVYEEAHNTTQPFNPGQASTPYQTTMHEQSGLPDTSFTENVPLLNQQTNSWEALTNNFPFASATDLEVSYSFDKKLQVKKVGFGKKTYPLFTNDKRGNQQLNPKLTKEIKNALGPRAEVVLLEDDYNIKEQQQNLVEAEKQKQELEKLVSEKEKKSQEVDYLKDKIDKTQAQIDAIYEEHGSGIEINSETQRLNHMKKNYQTDYENVKKEVASLEKQVKNKKNVEDKAARERAKLGEMVKKRDIVQEGLNRTKSLDDLNEKEAELRQQIAEDQAIIDATDTSPSDKQAAEARVEERNEELARLQPQIAEREEAMPLRERIKEIFKKHGVTVTAIFIAAGVTIGAVISSITKGLKATGKAMANGLKEIASKLGSMLPGLIGQVASFLFNTAAKAVGFLAEHTWLIILAVVAFLFEKYIKR